MLEKQSVVQLQHYTHLRYVLDKSMILGSPKQEKYKQGYLTAQTNSGNWSDQYLILSPEYIMGSSLQEKVYSSNHFHSFLIFFISKFQGGL